MSDHIAIQGIVGSNHHKVVCDFISKKASINACMSFNGLVNAVVSKDVDYGVMAIENSIAGSILPNYKLISDFDLRITAEYYLDIKHNLVALKGQNVDDIMTVNSHQMAFLQCENFFSLQPHIKLVEDVDTALPAQIIANSKIKNTAAIVPDGTAELFSLKVLEAHIQDNDLNSTRFVKVEKNTGLGDTQDFDKASVRFELEHQPGSLFKVMALLQDFNVNLTKIQSIPISQSKWNYAFYIDIIFSKDIDITSLITKLNAMTHHFKLLGIYKQAQK